LILLIKTPDVESPCELGLKLGGRLLTRARLRSIEDGQAVFYRLAQVLDALSFDLTSEEMFAALRTDLSDSPFLPTITDEEAPDGLG
jgi:hypothetical protein